MTKNAGMILELIKESDEHLTAEQIFLKIKERSQRVYLATVYNNLHFLHQKGMIRKLGMEEGPERYDRLARHDHMICRRCGSLSDILLQDLTKNIEEDMGIVIESYDLKIYYICEKCREKRKGEDI